MFTQKERTGGIGEIRWLRDKMKRLRTSRFALLCYPMNLLNERVSATRKERLFNQRAIRTRFPIRAIRYWWAHCALLEEIHQRQRHCVIADVGCNKGVIKRFIGHVPHATWCGLDKHIDPAPLKACGYEDLYECDFDRPLPLRDASVDIVIFLHVIEHLPRPVFTLIELSRILRPDGLLLAGSPVAPLWIARLRQGQLLSKKKKGKQREF